MYNPANQRSPILCVRRSPLMKVGPAALAEVCSQFFPQPSQEKTMTLRKLISFVVCVLLLNTLGFAQGGVATGDLHVTVKDPGGKLVTNATVTARNAAKALERSAAGNGQGEYRLLALPPGSYTVIVEAPGFANMTAENVEITVGQVADLPLTLSVAGTQEVVNVSSAAELVETTRSSTTDTVEQRRIDNLPINGRNYINFALTDSQVLRDNAPSIGAAPTSGLNISGQRGRSNLVNVDGADATDNSTNGVRSTVSQEAVQEFQIITNSYAAEYGRAAGGVVNIITRSGANQFHGDVFGYLRNRNFQAVNPFSTVPNPAYTRVQAGAAFGGPIKKDKTYYFFSYEVTRRHETGFSSIGTSNFDLIPFDTTQIGQKFGTLMLTQPQIQFLTNPAVLAQEGADPAGFGQEVGKYVVLAGASSGMAMNKVWPTSLMQGLTGFPIPNFSAFPFSCQPPGPCSVPSSFESLTSQEGNFPVFEGTSLYSLRLDHNISQNHRLMLRANVSPSTVTGIEVAGENQPFGQNAFSRTSQQTYRDAAGEAQETWTIGNNKVNEFRFQYARRGLSYFYANAPGASFPGTNIVGYAFIGREPYSYIQRTEQRYQFADNFSWSTGRHDTKTGFDFSYIPLKAIFTVNYGGSYSFGPQNVFPVTIAPPAGTTFPEFNAVQAYGAGIPTDLVQGLGNPHDSFSNKPLGLFWQDSWRVRSNLTFNYGVRYDVEFPPQLTPLTDLALAAYNQLGLQKGIQTDTNNIQPRIGLAWDPKGDGKTVIRSSYGMFYDHPLLGLYFLGDASDGSRSGQLLLPPGAPCTLASTASPSNLNASNTFQGILGAANCLPNATTALGYQQNSAPTSACLGETNPQRFDPCYANSLFLNQGYLTAGFPVFSQLFGYPQGKNFVYAYSQQANLTVEHDLGRGFALSLAYNFNGGRHLNRPINANPVRGDLLVKNWQAAVAAATAAGISPSSPLYPSSPLAVGICPAELGGLAPLGPYVPAALVSFFRPSGFNPSLMGGPFAPCIAQAASVLQADGLNAACNPSTGSLAGCVPFSDMDANFSVVRYL